MSVARLRASEGAAEKCSPPTNGRRRRRRHSTGGEFAVNAGCSSESTTKSQILRTRLKSYHAVAHQSLWFHPSIWRDPRCTEAPEIGHDKERGRKLHQDHDLYSGPYNFPLTILVQFSSTASTMLRFQRCIDCTILTQRQIHRSATWYRYHAANQ